MAIKDRARVLISRQVTSRRRPSLRSNPTFKFALRPNRSAGISRVLISNREAYKRIVRAAIFALIIGSAINPTQASSEETGRWCVINASDNVRHHTGRRPNARMLLAAGLYHLRPAGRWGCGVINIAARIPHH